MIKKLFVFLFLLICLSLAAQDMPFSVRSSTKYGISSMFGFVDEDSITYAQVRLIQEFKIKKFQLGLDLDFLFDEDLHLQEKDWDQLKDIPGKIYYFRYGRQGDPFFFHYGGITAYTIGNGLLMKNYTNMSFYPSVRNNGLLIGGAPPLPFRPSIEAFSSDFFKNDLLSLAASFHPLPDSSSKIFDGTTLGFAVVTDRNQFSNLRHTLPDSLYQALDPGRKDALTAYSFDINFPFSRRHNATFGTYAELSHINGHGTGFILPGVYADFRVLKVNLEYRLHNDGFIPAYFDGLYEENRTILEYDEEGEAQLLTMEDQLMSRPASYGWYGRVQSLIKNRIKSSLAFQYMYGSELERGKSLWFSTRIDTRYKHLESVSFSYSRVNVASLNPGKIAEPNAKLGFNFTVSLDAKRRWFVISKYSERYKDKEGGINWLRDTKRSFSIGLKYVY